MYESERSCEVCGGIVQRDGPVYLSDHAAVGLLCSRECLDKCEAAAEGRVQP